VVDILTKRAELENMEYAMELNILVPSSVAPPAVQEPVVAPCKDQSSGVPGMKHLPAIGTSSETNGVEVLKEFSSLRPPPPVKHGQPTATGEQPPVVLIQLPGAYSYIPGSGGLDDPHISLDSTLADVTDRITENPGHSSGNHQVNLVEAQPVLEDPEDGTIRHARPVNVDEGERQQQLFKTQQQLCTFALIVVAIAVAILLASLGGALSQEPRVVSLEDAGSAAHSIAQSEVPTSATVGELDLLFAELPAHTQATIILGNTPQYFAWEWLSHHQNITLLPEWRKKQLFALATFFYAFDGENWNPLIKDRWMDDTKEECLWFSSGFGGFVGGEYREWSLEVDGFLQEEPCNGIGEFTQINLQYLKLSGLKPSFPPEIALLASLSDIHLYFNDLEGPLDDLFPAELYEMKSLEEIWLCTNHVSSYIPSEMGKLTQLKILVVSTNSISGPLPTELGLMTSLQLLDLHNNDISGAMPSEIWHISTLKKLELSNMPMLTGPIPTDLPFLAGLRSLNLSGSPGLHGSIPEGWCILQDPSCSYTDWDGETIRCSLEFDCSYMLCGCGCPCSNASFGGGAHNQSLSKGA
jgi:hypothetical protein